MYELEFEVSEYLGDSSTLIALIPLRLPEEAEESEVRISLLNATSAREIVFSGEVSSEEFHLDKLFITSSATCRIGFTSKGKVGLLSTSNVTFNSSCTCIIADHLEMQGYSIDTFLPACQLANLRTISNPDIPLLKQLVKSVNMLPGSGEFVYDTRLPGYSTNKEPNSIVSITQLREACPEVKWVAPIVTWFGLSSNAGSCKIMPAVEFRDPVKDVPIVWRASEYSRESAHLISREWVEETTTHTIEERPSYGGTINDASVLSYLSALKERGYKIAFYPMLFLDVEHKPWRGHITGTAEDVNSFFENAEGYNKFILHYAQLVQGKVDAFIIGSEFRDLTKVRDAKGNFPAVLQLINLAKQVKLILGPDVTLTYAADWSEYHHTDGGYRPLDELWACDAIDVVGIDAYFPITSRTKGEITAEEIKHGWLSGEGYDYYIDWQGNEQPLGSDWAWKNLRHWWESEHFAPGGVKTAWQPRMKNIWFTEFGFASIHYTTNQPNVFYDPRCVDGGIPKNSSGMIDCEMQKLALRASLEILEEKFEFVTNKFIWAWDARPYPFYPEQLSLWSDGILWEKGHWISGKLYEKGVIYLRGDINIPQFSVTDARKVIIASSAAGEILKIKADEFYAPALNFSQEIECATRNNLEITEQWVTPLLKVNCAAEASIVVLGDGVLRGETLYILASQLTLAPALKLAFSKEITFNIAGKLQVLCKIADKSWTEYKGSKTTINYLEQIAHVVHISAPTIFIDAPHTHFQGTEIIAKRLALIGDELLLESLKTIYKVEDIFKGKKNHATGKRNSGITTTVIETPVQATIEAEEFYLRQQGMLWASGALIKTQKFDGLAGNYQFVPLELHDTTDTSNKTRKWGGFGGYTKSNLHQSGTKLYGAALIAADKCYIFAGDQIFLEASSIIGENIVAKAERVITLRAGIEVFSRDFSISSSGIRFSFNCRSGELAVGVAAYHDLISERIYQELPIYSAIIGTSSLQIEAKKLQQDGAVIQGSNVKIAATNWEATGPITRHIATSTIEHSELGVKLGFKESVSATARVAAAFARSAARISGADEFLNAAGGAYSTFRGATNIAAGRAITGGAWVATGHTVAHHEREELVQHSNKVVAETLEVTAEKLTATGLDFEGGEHSIRVADAVFNPTQHIVRETHQRTNIDAELAVSGSVGSSIGVAEHKANSWSATPGYNRIHADNLTLTGGTVRGALQVRAERADIALDELELRTVQSLAQINRVGGGFSIDPTAESLDALPRGGQVEMGAAASDITEERGGIIAGSGKIEVKKLALLGSIIVKRSGGSEVLEVITDDYHESSLHDSKTGYNLGFGVTATGAGSSFGAEVRIAAGEVTRTRALEAGVRVVEELDLEIACSSDSGENSGAESDAEAVVAPCIVRNQFAVGAEGFTGGDWGVDLSWAPLVDAQVLHHAWSGGVVGVGGRVLEGAWAAVSDAAAPVMKLLRLGDEIIPVSSAIFSELQADSLLRPAVAAGDTDELDEENDGDAGALLSDEEVIERLQAALEAEEKLVTEGEGDAAGGNAVANSDATLNLFQDPETESLRGGGHGEVEINAIFSPGLTRHFVARNDPEILSSRGISRGDLESTAPSRATGHGEGWDGGAADAPSGEVRIASTFGRLLGPSEAHASSAAFAAEEVVLSPAVAEFLGSSFTALSVKYGPKVAKFLITKVVPRAIPGVGAAFLAKDLYDAGRAVYHEFTAVDEEALKPQILSTPALEPVGPSILATPAPIERELELSKLPGFEVEEIARHHAVETFPDHSDLAKEMMIFYKKGDGERDAAAFDPSRPENHDKVRRTDAYGKLYRDAQDPRVWYSKERSGDRAHGGEHWKKFVEQDGYLEHVADVDVSGQSMNKHKGDRGKRINLKKTIGIK